MSLAESIVREILMNLGYRWPEKHNKYDELVNIVQDEINKRMDSAVDVATSRAALDTEMDKIIKEEFER